MSDRNLKPLFCAFCKKRIADHHIEEESVRLSFAHWRIYRLHCTHCGHDSYVPCAEAHER